jgi:hypothetical protein
VGETDQRLIAHIETALGNDMLSSRVRLRAVEITVHRHLVNATCSGEDMYWQ